MEDKFNKLIKTIRVRILLYSATVALLLFIFGMSSMSGDKSTEVSVGLLNIINSFLIKMGLNGMASDFFIRKLAHFCEYTLLGILYILDIMSIFGINGRKPILSLPFGILTAVLDEYSQGFAIGRSPQLKDVFFDSAGVLCGISAVIIILCLIKKACRQ